MSKPIEVAIFAPGIDRRAYVYRNLHQNMWSLRAEDGPYKGKVIFHAAVLEMVNAIPKVSDAGRNRVRREKRKNVHAGISGRLTYAIGWSRYPDAAFGHVYDDMTLADAEEQWDFANQPEDRVIRYNPYEDEQFHYSDGRPFVGSGIDGVRFFPGGIVAHVDYGIFLERLNEKWGQ